MARRSDGVTPGSVISATGARPIANNYTLAIWVDFESFPGGSDVVFIFNGNTASRGYGLNFRSANGVMALHAGINWFGGGAYSTTGWEHWVLRRSSGTSQIYRNAATFGATFAGTPNTPLSTDAVSIPGSSAMPVKFAEAAIWERALDLQEISALNRGYSPLLMPQSLKFYAPLIGGADPEQDLVNGLSLTVANASAVAHPRIIRPRRSKIGAYAPPTLFQRHFRFRTDADAVDATPSWGDAEDAA